jgi:hypothetical protein
MRRLCATIFRLNRGGTSGSLLQLLSGRTQLFSRFMPFWLKTIVQEPKSQRHGQKSLSQRKAWVGAFVGYGDLWLRGAYRM